MNQRRARRAFSLVEVVLALGVVSFALLAILGVFPLGLQTAHSAQNETRAAQIAQGIFGSIAAQASNRFTAVTVPATGNNPPSFDLSQSATPGSPQLYADNSGTLTTSSAGAIYAISITTNNTPAGFDPADAGIANQITISVTWPAAAAVASRTKRNFVQIISKY